MLRSFLISLSKAKWAKQVVTKWKVASKMANRFIAGETLEDAVRVVRGLNSEGIFATLDQLGENTTSREEAVKATRDLIQMLDAISANSLKSNVSVKLSQIGITIDESLCHENLRWVLKKAQESSNFIRIDMEDSSLTEKTIGAYIWARQQGFNNVGIVIQSYLYRSEKDIHEMNQYDTRVRLCKGAYKEPATVAYQKKSDVDANFDRLATTLFVNAKRWEYPEGILTGRFPPIPAIATHDPARIDYVLKEARLGNVPNSAYEFQMLHGIRRDLQEKLVRAGHCVRIYVPFGTHWYPYFMRRLAERPANLWFFVSNFFKK